MSWYRSREIPLVIIIAFAVFQLSEYYFVNDSIQALASTSRVWGIIIASIALLVGAITMGVRLIKLIQQRVEGYIFNIWTIILLVISIGIGLIPPLGANESFSWLYNTVYLTIRTSMKMLLAFYIVSAAYRSFKVRTIESGLLLGSTLLILLRNAPMTKALFPLFAVVGDWLYNIPTKAGQRSIIIGTALGIILLGIRTFLGYEKVIIGETGGGE